MEQKGKKGRKAEKSNRVKRLEMRFTEEEFTELTANSKNYKSISEYIRVRTFKKGSSLLNPIELIRALDDVCLEMKRVGTNINQIAKYINQRKEITSDGLIEEYDKHLINYVNQQKRLEALYRKIINL